MSGCDCAGEAVGLEQRTLVALLPINGVMFVAEVMVGWIAESTALLAASLRTPLRVGTTLSGTGT